MKLVLIRTSTEEQNPQLQLKDVKSLFTGPFKLVEEQQSAWKDKVRPKLEEIRDLIKARKVKDLYVWDLDRLYRNRKKLLEFFAFCKLYGCKIHSYRQQFLKTLNSLPPPFDEAMTDFMLQFWGWLAEDESNKKSDRVKNAIRIKNGKVVSYKGNKWGRPEITKRVVEEVVALKAQGLTLREIAAQVHYWDKSKNKHQLSKSSVHNILKNVTHRTS